MAAGRGRHRGEPLWIGQYLLHGVAPICDPMARDEGAGEPIGDGDTESAHLGGDHRRTARLRLDGDQAEALRIARHRNDVGGPVHLGQPERRLGREEGDPVGDAEFRGQVGECRRVLATGTRRTADDE